MRILILSDSHGDVESMKQAVIRTEPDQIIHLGDHWRDGTELKKSFPQLPVAQVPGNCDAYDLQARGPDQLILDLDGHRVMICHGHRYHVKNGLLNLGYAAREAGVELCLFGHTHVQRMEQLGDLTLLNPGSIGSAYSHDFAVAETDNGELRCALLKL